MFPKLIKLYYLPYRLFNQVLWAKKIGVKVGSDCRFYKLSFSTEPYLVEIGNHVSATKVHFETHDGGLWIFRKRHPHWDKISTIKIGNNVYLGYDVIILPGVKIGNNVIVGARSVVTRNIPDNSVAVGSPARVIKSTDDYYNKIKNEVIETKHLSRRSKKKFLLKHFNIS
ncbi:transferase hexapeptide (six repeat-containing protein) [Tangfeifania diversioriginum]|uniref:Transferase hexapeptide (Six repeat-containing protein) n=1 Tax=Tangfeifania diversioriginum TaxID=1168035 RepID=A0A1M6GRU3_9BACT|nr:acyltransferase [Tangfeifania diversioriginum]SHJ12629.1 transferase hexapeptide (six repeat-containing protein) [Tangfeifania diversioriginum]